MKRGWLWALISTSLAVLIALAFIYPDLMVSPGPLVHGHTEIQRDCYAYHQPWRGAASERCLKCHALPEIGLRTTKGVPIANRRVTVPFHQHLIEQDCTACHSDHAGPKFTEHSRKPFSHALLQDAVRDRCETCHAKPVDDLHRALRVTCGICHKTDRWKRASLDHALLEKAVLEHCDGCHKSPDDSLHGQVSGYCGQCHQPARWKPATFDHAKSFELDSDHSVRCNICHAGDGYRSYTCYGCHEHRQDQIRAKHEEEGIRDFADCARCHRSANDEPEGDGARDRRERD